jgi:mono/diheme cytochrome c family protein
MNVRKVVACLIVVFTVDTAHGQVSSTKSTSSGVFTDEQAKRGEIAYNANCVTCHGSALRSTDREIPNLTDKAFKFSWVGKTIAEKYEIARETMPPEEKHSLGDQVYLDIVTYILRFNKVPTGNRELKPDLETLKQVVISAPPE